jgi:hypothetical protein
MFFKIFSRFFVLPTKSDQESGKGLLDPEAGATSPTAVPYLKRPLVLGIAFCTVLLTAAGLIGLTVAARQEVLQGFQQFSCHHDDQECLQLLCPMGMEWSEEHQECSEPEGWECCTDVRNQKICFQDQNSEDRNKMCPFTIQIAGISPFFKEFCRPGFIWVPRLRRCWRSG